MSAGATHVAIMGGAYHGHTKAVIDLSPYKYEGPGGDGQMPYVHVLPCPDPYRCANTSKCSFAEAGRSTCRPARSMEVWGGP